MRKNLIIRSVFIGVLLIIMANGYPGSATEPGDESKNLKDAEVTISAFNSYLSGETSIPTDNTCGEDNCLYLSIIMNNFWASFIKFGSWEGRKTALEPGLDGSWDGVSVFGPEVLYDGVQYQMWYTGRNADGLDQIGYATSTDGYTWIKSSHNPVLPVGDPGSWDDSKVWAPALAFDGASWKMWYTGYSEMSGNQIGYATSVDGINWVKHANNPVFLSGTSGTWDESGVTSPYVILDQGVYHMWYSDDPYGSIGFSTSTDGVQWTRYDNNPVLEMLYDFEECTPLGLVSPTVVHILGEYHMWYQMKQHCRGVGEENYLRQAASPDGVNWYPNEFSPFEIGKIYPTVVSHTDQIRIWYVNLGKIFTDAAAIENP